MKKELDYHDVTIYSREVSSVFTRHHVSVYSKCKIGEREYSIVPILASPMYDVCGTELAYYLCKNNHIGGVLHKFLNEVDITKFFIRCSERNKAQPIALSVPLVTGIEEKLKSLKKSISDYFKITNNKPLNLVICLDTANGASTLVSKSVNYVKNELKEIQDKYPSEFNYELMSGNVLTKEGAEHLYSLGCKFVRVSVGAGNVCRTSHNTGIYRPPISAIKEIDKWRRKSNLDDFYLIADGGIDSSSKAMKAFAAGADFIMMGKAFADWGISNAPIKRKLFGKPRKIYRGSASAEIARISNPQEQKIIEGTKTLLPRKNQTEYEDFYSQFIGAIKSSMSYCNARTFDEFKKNSILVKKS
jgi:IMP dehydrogenase/GMP reductase